jgi:cyanophycinase
MTHRTRLDHRSVGEEDGCPPTHGTARQQWSAWLGALLILFRAADAPADDKKPPGPKPAAKGVVGTLFVVGGGSLTDVLRDRFLELAGGPEKARLVVIPTASHKADPDRLQQMRSYAYWAPLVASGKIKSLVFLHPRVAEQANDPTFVKPIREATAVWLGGGDQSRLMAAYKGTLVEKELHALLERGGVIGGTSAGAAVMSDVMIRYGNPIAEVGPGFGLLRGFVVDQHFAQRNRLARLLGVLAKFPQHLGMGIDEQTAAIVSGQSMTVMGTNHISICFPAPDGQKNQVKVYNAGDRVDLNELTQALTALTRPASAKDSPSPRPATSQDKGVR